MTPVSCSEMRHSRAAGGGVEDGQGGRVDALTGETRLASWDDHLHTGGGWAFSLAS